MPADRFWIANLAFALVWAPLLILVGDGIGKLGERLIGAEHLVVFLFAGVILFGIGSRVGFVAREPLANSTDGRLGKPRAISLRTTAWMPKLGLRK